MIELIPSILTGDPEEAQLMLKQISEAGKFGRVQVDFVDGQYANNLTIKPENLDIGLAPQLKFDAHLMVTESNIGSYLEMVNMMGYDRVVPQLESVSHPELFLGLAIDIHSPLSAIEPYLKELKLVVVMAIEPGFGGQEFNDKAFEKIKRLSYLRNLRNLSFRICVDGGVQKEYLEKLTVAGADEACVGGERLLAW